MRNHALLQGLMSCVQALNFRVYAIEPARWMSYGRVDLTRSATHSENRPAL